MDHDATGGGGEWRDATRAARYRAAAPTLPHWRESETALVEQIPARVDRMLDIGTGDGRLIALVRAARPCGAAIGLDLSPPMLAAAGARLSDEPCVELIEHDLTSPLPQIGTFDLVVSGFAIHHLEDERKRELYGEILERLRPGGRFLNLEHVASATPALHREFLDLLAEIGDEEDPSNRLAPAWTQVEWLTELGYEDAECFWKWREIALIGGRRPDADGGAR